MSAIEAFIEDAPTEARHVLHYFGDPSGQIPGSFTQLVISAAFIADQDNQRRIAKGFPLLAALVKLAKAGDIDTLRLAAKGNRNALDRIARVMDRVEAEAAA